MEEGSELPTPRRPRRRRAAAVLAGLIVLSLLALWTQRRPIAGRFVDREFATRGVPARYRIADLGLGRQRLTDVVIGDPARPDLVADWIETEVVYDFSGPRLEGVSAGRVRLRARWDGKRVSLGAIDKLLPPPSGQPLALPALRLDVADGRMRLETPYGDVGIKLTGSGRLDDGFDGRVAMVADRLARDDCDGRGVRAAWRVRTTGAVGPAGQRLRVEGPLTAARLTCAGVQVAAWRSDVDARLLLGTPMRSAVDVRVVTGPVVHAATQAASVAGRVTYDGAGRSGEINLVAASAHTTGARADRVGVIGTIADVASVPVFDGRVMVGGGDGSTYVPRLVGRAAGTPVGPLVDRVGAALVVAARRGDGDARVRAALGQAPTVMVGQASWRAASGATLRIEGDRALRWSHAGIVADAIVETAGGGLPQARIALAKSGAARPWRGTATIAPYASGGARLELSPVTFALTDRGALALSTRALVSGPLGDGRVEALSLPVDLTRTVAGAIAFDRGCAPVAWRRLVVGPLDLDPARLLLCPSGNAIVSVDGARIGGGARIASSRLGGRLGGSPLTLETGAASLRPGDRDFRIADVAATIGRPERPSRLTVGTLTGSLAVNPAGTFAKGGGQIGAVPLVMSGAEGRWSFANGALTVTGATTVSDAAASPRFKPMIARGVDLRLANGNVTTTGTLVEPTTGTAVADVSIAHRLGPGTGHADIDVPNLAFREGFQPDLLTPLTFGVVADVRGLVTGKGRIDWTPDRVTSGGRFATEAMDLAAAFGPVQGLATTLTFTDLLGMVTAPGQVATVRSVNPGIQVEDGIVRYALEGPTLVRVEGARWPFAGGSLTLEPTLLDFSRERERRMTFRVAGAAADRFLQQFAFENIQATGVFDGVLPMVFDEAGGRIVGGALTVREGGGTLAYVGTLTQEQLGFWGNLAFQALKSLRYRSLQVRLNGPLAGEMVTDVRFAGVSQGEGAKGNFLIRRLQRLPFVFNIRIKAPFRGLLDSAQSFYDPRRLIQRNLPALLEEQNKRAAPPPGSPVNPVPVQPPASGPVR